MELESINDYEEFKNINTKNKNLICYFYTDWCSSCLDITEVINQFYNKLEPETKDDYKIIKYNITENNEKITQELKINSVPLVINFKDGNVIEKLNSNKNITIDKLNSFIF